MEYQLFVIVVQVLSQTLFVLFPIFVFFDSDILETKSRPLLLQKLMVNDLKEDLIYSLIVILGQYQN